MTAFTDDFNRANAASLGANYTDYAIGSALRVQGNRAEQTTASTSGASRRSATTLAVPHWAEGFCALAASGDAACGVLVRCSAAAVTQYVAQIDRTGGTITAQILKVVAGTPSSLSSVAFGATSGTVRMYATGTTTTVLTLVIDGVQISQVSDSSSPLSTQTQVGLVIGGAISSVDNLAGSDVATVPLAPTGLGATPGDGQVALAWTAPFNGMASISDYVIEYSTDNAAWSTFSDGTSTAVTTTVTGLSNNTPYWFRVSATNSTGTGAVSATAFGIPAAQVSFVGIGVFAVDTVTGNPVSAAFPASYSAVTNDVAIVAAQGLHNNTTSLAPTAPSGYNQIDTRFQNIATYDLQITGYIDKLTSGDSAPSVTVPAAYSTSSGGLSAYMGVFRGVDTTTAQDATAVVSSGAAAATFTPTGITTVNENAMVVSLVASADDNALGLSVAQGFTLRAGGTIDASAYDTTTGGDHAMGMATRLGALQALQTQAAAPAQLTAVDNTAGTAFNYRWNGAGVLIYIMGVGVRSTHNDITGRVEAGWGYSGLNPLVDSQNHDTGMASVAAGTTYGVAKGATIVPIKYTAAGTAGPPSTPGGVAAYIAACQQILSDYQGRAAGTKAVVSCAWIYYSLGDVDENGHTVDSTDMTNIETAVQNLINAGIPFVQAAGNSTSVVPVGAIPVTMADVICVGNVNAATLAMAADSCYGAAIDIWAAGSGASTLRAAGTSDSATAACDGTSEATQLVSGTIAALFQGHPSYTPAQVRAVLLAGATTTGSVGAGSTTKMLNSLYMPDGAIGTSIMPTWSETLVGNDAWAAITVALRAQSIVPVTGTIAVSTAASTLAASGTRSLPDISGTIAVSTAASTLAASGTRTLPTITGTIAVSTSASTLAASGTRTLPAITGTIAVSTDASTLAAAGSYTAPNETGTIAVSTAASTLAASGTHTPPPITGTIAVSTAASTMAASGTRTLPTITGTIAVTTAASSLAAAGTFTAAGISGTIAISTSASTMAGSGTYTVPNETGTIAVSTAASTMAASGTFTPSGFSGAFAVTTTASTLAASGTRTIPAITGTINISTAASTLTASGTSSSPGFTGTINVTTSASTMAASGSRTTPSFTGTVAVTTATSTIAAVGTHTPPLITGTINVTTTSATLTSIGSSGTGIPPVFTGPRVTSRDSSDRTTGGGHLDRITRSSTLDRFTEDSLV